MATPPSPATFTAPLTFTAPPVTAVPPVTAAGTAFLSTAVPAGMAAGAAAIAGLLAGHAAAAALVGALTKLGFATAVATAAVRIAGRPPALIGRAGTAGPAARQERRTQLLYRAAFLVNSADRLQRAFVLGDVNRFESAIRADHTFFAQHLAAMRHRAAAAAQVDRARDRFGPILGWYLGHAAHHTPECVAAAGHRFTVVPPPIIGLPGTVHARCACYAGPDPGPHAGWVDDAVVALMASGGH